MASTDLRRNPMMGGGVPVRDEVFKRFAAPFDHVSFPGLFEAMARRELRADPELMRAAGVAALLPPHVPPGDAAEPVTSGAERTP